MRLEDCAAVRAQGFTKCPRMGSVGCVKIPEVLLVTLLNLKPVAQIYPIADVRCPVGEGPARERSSSSGG